jgi:deoxyribodipyrimidine photo-lyase
MVHPDRIFYQNFHTYTGGPVVYWMQRDQRVSDNWALVYAQETAMKANQPIIVVFNLSPVFLNATHRHFTFMLKGLQSVEKRLSARNIPFHMIFGQPSEAMPRFLEEIQAGLIVSDFNPLRNVISWKTEVNKQIRIPFIEIDAHNILPARKISDKAEYGAFTLRKKIEKKIDIYLEPVPEVIKHPFSHETLLNSFIDWEVMYERLNLAQSADVKGLLPSGEEAASIQLNLFLKTKLDNYATDRNFPEKKGQSNLSPYLHFGQISAQKVALEVKNTVASGLSKQQFLEELIVRRELSDNYCLYCLNYDRVEGFQPWARKTLDNHRDDIREYTYSTEIFEYAKTHDPLWNAAQMEMITDGKMHGYMRMYWAKKILEWTENPEIALDTAIYLNDKYSLDGRDPNGYAGIAWAIGGVHDRPWGERSVFGMIRYMNFQGCKRKFDVDSYIRKGNRQ